MGNNISKEQRQIYEHLKYLLICNDYEIPSKDLKDLLIYAQKNFPEVKANSALNKKLWDQIGIKLFDDSTRGNKSVSNILPIWRIIVEIVNNPFSKFIISVPAIESDNEILQTPVSNSLSHLDINVGGEGSQPDTAHTGDTNVRDLGCSDSNEGGPTPKPLHSFTAPSQQPREHSGPEDRAQPCSLLAQLVQTASCAAPVPPHVPPSDAGGIPADALEVPAREAAPSTPRRCKRRPVATGNGAAFCRRCPYFFIRFPIPLPSRENRRGSAFLF